MSKLTELTAKLKEIFQINRADLDFGIYRILNSRNREISDYLERRLPEKIKAAFANNQQVQVQQWQKELEEAKAQAIALGADPDSLPKVQTLQAQIKQATQSGTDGEAAVFSHLLTFFSRYYDEGDFISQRRYKGDTYAIPYNGEEVMLHWANKDQYYTKSGENFSNYRFKLDDGREVLFRLIAADTEKDNRKENDKKRLFVLAEPRMIEKQDEDGEVYEEELKSIVEADNGNSLEIYFEYQVIDKSAKQDAQNQVTLDILQKQIPENWQIIFNKAPTESNPNRTLLEKHLSSYTQKNTADYFIHKDLGGFLRQELDFYIKNEVMHLDNIQQADGIKVIEESLRQIQVIRSIAHDLIDFLAQLEDFQKKLWLKKKFVAGCHYLITLDYVPEALLPTVINNERQQSAWQQLFAVTVDKNADAQSFAQQYPHLMVDTSLFPIHFQTALLSAISDEYPLDEATDGVLIHADNFQALNLLQARYREQVKCIYIDPPYNTEDDRAKGKFIYKDGYDSSTWLALVESRLQIAYPLLCREGVNFISIDDHEQANLKQLCNITYGKDNFVAELVWNKQHSQQQGLLKKYHEYIEIYVKDLTRQNNISGGEGIIDAGALKKISKANPESEFLFPAGVRFEAKDGTKISGTYGDSEKVTIVSGILEAKDGKTVHPVRISAGWTQRNQMEKFFLGQEVFDTKGQKVIEFYFSSTGKLKCKKERTKITPSTLLPEYGMSSKHTKNLADIIGKSDFNNPKPVPMLQQIMSWFTQNTDVTLDYFAGSGTTAHAVINLNREDGGKRKYILVEQGEYFDTVLKPRVQKVIFSETWKDGKPQADKEKGYNGVSQIVKVLKLESYEDTLNNLQLTKSISGFIFYAT